MPTEPPAPRVLVRSEQSRGRISVIESTMPAGATASPLHTHEFDETFYVLEGELIFHLGDELLCAGAGERSWLPRDPARSLAPSSASPASAICRAST